MWIRDHHERDVWLLELSVVFQPNLRDDVNESKLIMQLIPYPAFVNQSNSTGYDDDGEPETNDYCHPSITIAVGLRLRLKHRPVLDELVHVCKQDNC